MKKVSLKAFAGDAELETWSGKRSSSQRPKPCIPGTFDIVKLRGLGLHGKSTDAQVDVDPRIEKAVEKIFGDGVSKENIVNGVRNYIFAARLKKTELVNNNEIGRISTKLFDDPLYILNTGHLFGSFYSRIKRTSTDETILGDFHKFLCKINSVYLQDKK